MIARMKIPFIKMHGLGNDFVIIDNQSESYAFPPERICFLSDRRIGIGCDQLIILEKALTASADIFMRIYNPDGTEAGACGNATRCVAALVGKEKGNAVCVIETITGLLYCTLLENGAVQVDMGAPRLEWHEIPLSKQCDTLYLPLDGVPVGVSMGNPHCVFFCDNAEDVNVDNLGVKVEHDPLFPERTNVEYVSMLGDDILRMRVWERGAGVTQACGTGACAAAVAAIRRGLTRRCVQVVLDGGTLEIEWREADGHVLMTGPATYVYEGSVVCL